MTDQHHVEEQRAITSDTLHYLSMATAHLTELRIGVDYYTGNELSPADLIYSANALLWDAHRLLDLTIAQQRLNGTTWQTIADALEVTRQAAQQRFGNIQD